MLFQSVLIRQCCEILNYVRGATIAMRFGKYARLRFRSQVGFERMKLKLSQEWTNSSSWSVFLIAVQVPVPLACHYVRLVTKPINVNNPSRGIMLEMNCPAHDMPVQHISNLCHPHIVILVPYWQCPNRCPWLSSPNPLNLRALRPSKPAMVQC